ncbi:MAG TPA: proton-conducting transporter membrane subunit [Vicinamibacterales bacterium]|nr:proton-conducting transporter membrane subunit [Vicinamibacterales bacterium]
MLWFALLLSPVVAALAAVALPIRAVRPVNTLLAAAPLAAALGLCDRVLAGQPAAWPATAPFLRADALSALLTVCIAFVALLVAWLGLDGGREPRVVRRFAALSNLFTFTMLAAVTANNVGVMWVSIEATTITSALLIPLKLSKASVEASWKYIVICSVGIALAFVGTVLAYFDFVNLAGRVDAALNWTVLVAAAPHLHAEVVRLAFVFLLIGYGTKAGLSPMHTWLPDAHAEAPAPLSAMMSGTLLAVALYAIARWQMVVAAAGQGVFASRLLMAAGMLTLVIATFNLVLQKNFKRMLAYSSVEHTGLTCLGLALGPLGIFAALLHLLNHSVAKSMAFLLAGRVQHRYHTADLDRVTGLQRVMPRTASGFAVAVLALLGLPPFGLFISELALFRAGFATGHPWLMAAVLVLLLVVFASMTGHLGRMLYGEPPEGVPTGEPDRWALLPLAASVAILLVLGLSLPGPVSHLLARGVEVWGR